MNNWISVDNPPKDRQCVICGHALGKWVRHDIIYVSEDNSFRVRVNAGVGGDAGYKQKNTKKANGIDPAGPDEWLWGGKIFPTHWQPYPNHP